MESMIKYSQPISPTIPNFKKRCILQEEEIPLIAKDQIVYQSILPFSPQNITPQKTWKLRLYLELLKIKKRSSQSQARLDLIIILFLNF
jgi:hypothetical protein